MELLTKGSDYLKNCEDIPNSFSTLTRKHGTKEQEKIFSNEIREHLSKADKGSYYNQSEWLEEYRNSGLYYSRAFDETYVNCVTSDNNSDTSDEKELQPSDEDYEGGEAQGNKDDETRESNENFDC